MNSLNDVRAHVSIAGELLPLRGLPDTLSL